MYQFNLGPEFKGFKKMLKKDLAEQLGISGAMVSRLAKRGMPTDSLERAQRWRRRHLEPGRMKGVRFDPSQTIALPPKQPDPKPSSAPESSPAPSMVLLREVEMAARCCAIALRGTDEGSTALLVEELRQRLRQLPPEAQPAMPLRTWIALVDWVLSEQSEVRRFESQDAAVTPDDFAMLVNAAVPGSGASWLFEACDWNGYAEQGMVLDPDGDEGSLTLGEQHD